MARPQSLIRSSNPFKLVGWGFDSLLGRQYRDELSSHKTVQITPCMDSVLCYALDWFDVRPAGANIVIRSCKSRRLTPRAGALLRAGHDFCALRREQE